MIQLASVELLLRIATSLRNGCAQLMWKQENPEPFYELSKAMYPGEFYFACFLPALPYRTNMNCPSFLVALIAVLHRLPVRDNPLGQATSSPRRRTTSSACCRSAGSCCAATRRMWTRWSGWRASTPSGWSRPTGPSPTRRASTAR